MQATDADEGSNAVIRYNIESTSPLNVFHLNESTGLIRATSILDRELYAVYKINVSATDAGSPRLTSYTIVTVTLTDINDNYPVFMNLPNTTNVKEDTPVGSIVFNVKAVDNDDGENGRLSYLIVSGINTMSISHFNYLLISNSTSIDVPAITILVYNKSIN